MKYQKHKSRAYFKNLAEKHLSIIYGKDSLGDPWSISFSLPSSARIRVNSKHSAQMSQAQIRGMLIEFGKGIYELAWDDHWKWCKCEPFQKEKVKRKGS